MLPLYEKTENELDIRHIRSRHIAPHLHEALECVYVTDGTLEIGIGKELYHMKKGDFAIVFPNLIHHYQVFDTGNCRAYYLWASPSLCGLYLPLLRQSRPRTPVIPSELLHPDIVYSIHSLFENPAAEEKTVIYSAFVRLILARSLPIYQLSDKPSPDNDDIIYQTVSYISCNFKNHITLTGMARDLGFSPYALSRVFSGTFHKNFNHYLNDTRLDYACSLLQYSGMSITEILVNAGFDSQRTFNRVFSERMHMSPREYRQMCQNED